MNSICCEIIKTCPLSCLHCSAKSHINTNRFIPLTDIKKIISKAPNDLETFFISGGEPLLHPNINEIVSFLKSKNIKPIIYSSGCDIERKSKVLQPISIKKLQELEESGLNSIVFSLYSLQNKIHDNFTNTPKSLRILTQTLSNTKFLKNTSVELSFLPLKDTWEEAKKIIDFSKEYNISKINILKLINQGRAKENGLSIQDLSEEQEQNFLKVIKSQTNTSPTIEISKLYDCDHYENLQISPYTAGLNESFITYNQVNLQGRRFRDLAK